MRISLAHQGTKVTFTVTNWDYFSSKLDALVENEDKVKYLAEQAKGDLRHHVKMKVGSSNNLNDRITVNSAMRKPKFVSGYSEGSRKGYMLVTAFIK